MPPRRPFTISVQFLYFVRRVLASGSKRFDCGPKYTSWRFPSFAESNITEAGVPLVQVWVKPRRHPGSPDARPGMPAYLANIRRRF